MSRIGKLLEKRINEILEDDIDAFVVLVQELCDLPKYKNTTGGDITWETIEKNKDNVKSIKDLYNLLNIEYNGVLDDLDPKEFKDEIQLYSELMSKIRKLL